jgi:3-hydroxyisobutyrate dehydrogenase-like beta-hydroxyacid dehydrogenase
MGGAMARNLAVAGHDLTVYDLDPARVADLVRSGARPAASGAELAGEVDVLFTSLPGPRQAAAAMPGLIDALPPGATWVDMTTNDRELVFELARRAEARRIAVLDAPVTGAIDAAMAGPDMSTGEHEVELYEEVPVVEKRTVPKERVRLDKETRTDEQPVVEHVRNERIEADDDLDR